MLTRVIGAARESRAESFQAGSLRYSLAGLIAVVCWLLVGELGIAMRERWAIPTGLVALSQHGASATSVSLVLSTVPAILSLFVVPYIGFRSDHHRSRWGRRRPFLMVSAPIGALAMLCVALAPALADATHALLASWSPGLRALNLGFFSLFWTVFDCAAITTLALFSGLVNDVLPRCFIGRFFAVFRIMGLGVAIVFNSWLLALTDDYLVEILLAIAIIFGVATPLMCLMIRESPSLHLQACQPSAERGRFAVARTHVAECFTQAHYLWAFATFMLAAVAFSPFNTFSQSYALSLGISKAELGSLTAQAYAVSIASAFGVGWLADRIGALKLSTIMMSAYVLIALSGSLLVEDASAFRWFYLTHVIMSGAYFTAASSMPMLLFPSSEFVRYNSSKDIVVAFASILVSACQGPVLDMSGRDYKLTIASATMFSLLCVLCMLQLLKTSGKRQ